MVKMYLHVIQEYHYELNKIFKKIVAVLKQYRSIKTHKSKHIFHAKNSFEFSSISVTP